MENETVNLGLLLEGCQRGNRHSQERLYSHYHGYALSICLRYSKNRLEAREILNEAFFKVFTHLHQYDKSFSFTTWLRRILINTAIDYYRKQKKQPLFVELDHLGQFSEAPMDDFELDPDLDALPILQELPPAYRIVFNLYVMEGYKHHEIAEKLDISINTSKSNLARAKQKLKELIHSRTEYQIKTLGNG